MSSILDALKKLEDEKQKESRRLNSDVSINQAILNDGRPGSNASGSSRIAITIAIMLAGGGLAVWMFSEHKADKAIQHPVTAQPETRTVVAPPSPTLPVLQKNSHNDVSVNKQAAAKVVKSDMSRSAALPPQQPAVQEVAVQESPKRPVLRVMGIAYHDSGTNSVAIVNGTPVSVGAQIDGAKVEEILKDKVRFSYGAERFDVMLAR
jgi:general secretion pathway protein B